MGLINHTKNFAIFKPLDKNSTTWTKNAHERGVLGMAKDNLLMRTSTKFTGTDAKGNTSSYIGTSRIGGINGDKLINKATFDKGGIGDRIRWNTGGGAKASQLGAGDGLLANKPGKLSFGSKAKIGAITAGSGLIAGKVGGTIAEQNARIKAAKAGLKPGTPEYTAYVKGKANQGKWISRAVGGTVGFLGSRYLGKNTFKAVSKFK